MNNAEILDLIVERLMREQQEGGTTVVSGVVPDYVASNIDVVAAETRKTRSKVIRETLIAVFGEVREAAITA